MYSCGVITLWQHQRVSFAAYFFALLATAAYIQIHQLNLCVIHEPELCS